MERTPMISAIMAVYNGEDFLRETLDSVVNQTFTDWECIIVNDCSTDGSLDILNEYAAKDSRFRVYSNKVNLRLAKSLNAAIDEAEGKYILRFDADDPLMACRFERQVAYMEANPNVDISFPQYYYLTDGVLTTGSCGRYLTADAIAASLLMTNPVFHPGIIAKRTVYSKYRYNGAHTCTEDIELWTRMSAAGEKFACQNEYLCLYRVHGGQITVTQKPAAKEEMTRVFEYYYSQMLGIDDKTFAQHFTDNVYFHQNDDIDMVLSFYRTLKKQNKIHKKFSAKMIRSAAIELVSNTKRINGVPKSQYYKFLGFGGLAFLTELLAQRKRRTQDLKKSIAAAENAGYQYIGKPDGVIPTFKYERCK